MYSRNNVVVLHSTNIRKNRDHKIQAKYISYNNLMTDYSIRFDSNLSQQKFFKITSK